MADSPSLEACTSFATTLAEVFSRILSQARGGDWHVSLTEPPPETMPTLESPVQYCLRFGERLQGGCYAVFDELEVAIFSGAEKAAAGDGKKVAEPESPEATMLELLRSFAMAIPEVLSPSHGKVTTAIERVEVLDPEAAHALELRARGPAGVAAVMLLHFDPSLLASLSLAARRAPGTGIGDAQASQANLGLVMDVELSCTLRFGQRQLSLREILDLASGSVVELDRQVDEPVELILDGRVIARGEAVIIDGNYGLRVTQVLHSLAY